MQADILKGQIYFVKEHWF